jgi:hypothetical protein
VVLCTVVWSGRHHLYWNPVERTGSVSVQAALVAHPRAVRGAGVRPRVTGICPSTPLHAPPEPIVTLAVQRQRTSADKPPRSCRKGCATAQSHYRPSGRSLLGIAEMMISIHEHGAVESCTGQNQDSDRDVGC